MNRNELIKVYTSFVFVEQAPEKADILLIPGSPTAALGKKAAELYRAGFVPKILVSGRYSICEDTLVIPKEELSACPGSYTSEAGFLTAVMVKNGVPGEAIWQEQQASYTYENAIFSHRLLENYKYPVQKALLCCKPSHARRCLLYYRLLFPDTQFLVCPCDHAVTATNWYRTEEGIDTVLGELRRCGTQFGEILKEGLETT